MDRSALVLVVTFTFAVFGADRARADVDASAGAALSQLVAQAFASDPGLEVVTQEDLRRALAFEGEKQLVGCDDTSCLAEVAGAMGTRHVVFGRVDRLGRLRVLSLSLFDSQTAKVRAKVTKSAPSMEALVPALDGLAAALRAKVARPDKGRAQVLVLDVTVHKPARPARPPSAAAAVPSAATRPPPRGGALGLGPLAPAVRCLLRTFPRVHQSEARYRSWRGDDGDAPPTCTERYVSYGLYAPYTDAPGWCARAARGVDDKKLTAALEAAAAFGREAFAPIVEAERYYDDGDYEDDSCDKGKRLHPRLLASFARAHEERAALEEALWSRLARDLSRVDGGPKVRAVATSLAALVAVARAAPARAGEAAAPDFAARVDAARAAQRELARAFTGARDANGVRPLRDVTRELKKLARKVAKGDAPARPGWDPWQVRARVLDVVVDVAAVPSLE